ncbi:MAG: hypothetical protein KDI35_02840, partial [Gammaproteobacteria bacterium]|nr:hypothetical protein [Gammaproteobacteria bacterium]
KKTMRMIDFGNSQEVIKMRLAMLGYVESVRRRITFAQVPQENCAIAPILEITSVDIRIVSTN